MLNVTWHFLMISLALSGISLNPRSNTAGESRNDTIEITIDDLSIGLKSYSIAYRITNNSTSHIVLDTVQLSRSLHGIALSTNGIAFDLGEKPLEENQSLTFKEEYIEILPSKSQTVNWTCSRYECPKQLIAMAENISKSAYSCRYQYRAKVAGTAGTVPFLIVGVGVTPTKIAK